MCRVAEQDALPEAGRGGRATRWRESGPTCEEGGRVCALCSEGHRARAGVRGGDKGDRGSR